MWHHECFLLIIFSLMNSTECMTGDFVVLYLGGYRRDYLSNSPYIMKMAQRGTIRPLKPVFPNHVLPNLYSLATGYPPDVHQIFADQMQFRFGEKDQRIVFKDNCCQKDSWWWYADERAIPFWTKILDHEYMIVKCINVPGCCALFDNKSVPDCIPFSYKNSVKKVLKLVREEQFKKGWRFTVAYLAEPYETAIKRGVHSVKTRRKIEELDRAIGKAFEGLENKSNIVIVSAAGATDIKRKMDLSFFTDLSRFDVTSAGSVTLMYSKGQGAYFDRSILDKLSKYHDRYLNRRKHSWTCKHTYQNHWTDVALKPRLADIWVFGDPGYIMFPDQESIRKSKKFVAASGLLPTDNASTGFFLLAGPAMPHMGEQHEQVSIIDVYHFIHNFWQLSPNVSETFNRKVYNVISGIAKEA